MYHFSNRMSICMYESQKTAGPNVPHYSGSFNQVSGLVLCYSEEGYDYPLVDIAH